MARMERRRDYRHVLAYTVSLKCPHTRRIIDRAWTEDVSASGVRIRTEQPHELQRGDRLELRLFAPISGLVASFGDMITLATDAVVTRCDVTTASMLFQAPLVY